LGLTRQDAFLMHWFVSLSASMRN